MSTLKIAPDLYAQPAKSPISGARYDYREISLLAADLITTQIVALAILPAGCRLLDAFIESGDLDSGSPAITVNVGILNTYYNKKEASVAAPAAYNSGGVTDTGVTPALVSGQNLFTSEAVSQAGGRANMSLAACHAIGVDYNNDRIIAVQLAIAPATAQAGFLGVGVLFDAA